jgi:hypothetical protein
VRTNWQASAKNASQAALPPFDLSQPMDRGPYISKSQAPT